MGSAEMFGRSVAAEPGYDRGAGEGIAAKSVVIASYALTVWCAMKRSIVFLALAVYICFSCVAASCSTPEDRLKINVVNSADTATALPGVTVSAIDRRGNVKELGKTDQFGEITIQKSTFREVKVLLFYHKYFFCGALRVQEDGLLNYDERLLALAPIVVR